MRVELFQLWKASRMMLNRGRRLLHNAPGNGEIVDALEKTDVLEGGANAFLPTYLQKIRITFGQMILSGEFQRRGGNDVRRAQPGGTIGDALCLTS